MNDTDALLEILVMDSVVWSLSIGILLMAALVSRKPVIAWPVRTNTFLRLAVNLIRESNEVHLRKLVAAAPRAHVPILVGAWLGGEDTQAIHEELAAQRRSQFLKLAVVGVAATGLIAVTLYARSTGYTDYRLAGPAAVALACLGFAMLNLYRTGRDCDRLIDSGLEGLQVAREDRRASW